MLEEIEKRPGRLIPATPTKVKQYLLEILGSGRPMKRDELVPQAATLARREGFTLQGAAIPTVKKALKLLAEEGKVKNPQLGWWMISSVSDPPLDQPLPELPEQEEEEIDTEPEQRIAIEREIGDGPESVYVYYHDQSAELARLKGASVWECKVGSTVVGEPVARVIGQGALTAFPHAPIIGLVIRTQDARSLEHALHNALTLAGKHVEGGGGSEWFVTSPDRIERWVQEFWKSLTTF